MESESKQRVVYWPGVVLVGLVAACSVFSAALAMLMLNVVEVPSTDPASRDDWTCGAVRDMVFPAPQNDEYVSSEVEVAPPGFLAACDREFASYIPSVVTAGAGSLGLFLASAAMLTVQIRRRGFSQISHRPEPSYASPEY